MEKENRGAKGAIEFARVIHPLFFQHDHLLRKIKAGLNGPRLQVNTARFHDGTPWIQVRPIGGEGTRSELGDQSYTHTAIVPMWISEQFGSVESSLFAAMQLGNALTHTESGRTTPYAQRLLALVPFIEIRQDRDSPLPNGQHRAGEAINAEMFANVLAASGYREMIVLDPHSAQAIDYFVKAGIEVLSLTTSRLFADFLKNNTEIGPNHRVVALDKGSLQRCLKFAEALGVDPLNQMVVLDKTRGVDGKIDDLLVVHDSLKDADVIIYDDIIDTSGSIGKTCQKLRTEFGCRSITVVATHGVLSYPAVDNIIRYLGDNIIDRLIISDSLPNAQFNLQEIPGVEVVEVGGLLAEAAKTVAAGSIEAAKANEQMKPHILVPRLKLEVWQKFKEQAASSSAASASQEPEVGIEPTV